MLINLIPDFLDILAQPDPEAAYHRFLDAHRPLLAAYWSNYVLDLDSPHALEVITAALRADRSDLFAMLDLVDVARLAEEAMHRAEDMLQVDRATDCVLMVGMGGANAGELVVGGRGVAFVCVEHFTGRVNPETHGMGLPPEQVPLWVAHGGAHAVRYTSSGSASELRRLIAEAGGYYDYWTTGSRVCVVPGSGSRSSPQIVVRASIIRLFGIPPSVCASRARAFSAALYITRLTVLPGAHAQVPLGV